MALADQLPKDKAKRLKIMQRLLKDACARANEEMIGIITPEERKLRRLAAILVLLAIVVTFTFAFRRIFQAFTPPMEEEVQLRRRQEGLRGLLRYRWAYLLLLPALLTIFIWHYIPVVRGTVMAFMDYRLMGDSRWVGLDNFGDILFDNFWWAALANSLRYSFLVIAMTFLPPIILAIMLQELPVGTLLYRTIYYLPAVITGLVTVLLWKQFYQPSEQGTLNAIVMKIPAIGFIGVGFVLFVIALMFARRLWSHEMYLAGWGFVAAGLLLFYGFSRLAFPIIHPAGETIMKSLALLPSRLLAHTPEPYRWLIEPETAMIACVIPMVWAGMGPGCLIYLAALKGIPDDYYEAADLDGANFIDKILFVVFPTLKVLILINFVGVFIGAWYGAAGNILVMTGGGANTEVADLHIWYKAFTYLKFGPATAMAWMLGFLLIGFTLNQLKVLSRVEFRATGATQQ
jgi:multiple sugar transport system permease protein